VDLTLGSSSADGAPGDKISDELWCDRIEKFSTARETHFSNLQQQTARHAQTLIYLKTVIDEWIINQTFLSDNRPWFFKVDAHNDEQRIIQLLRDWFEAFGILNSCIHIVN
jgi:hypothetical protein